MAAHLLAASASNLQVTSLLALRFLKCDHMDKRNEIMVVENRRTLLDVFEDKHGEMTKNSELKITCNTSMDNAGTSFEVQPNMIIGDLISTFNMKHLEFKCVTTTPTLDEMVIAAGQAATKTAVDAFQLMMAGGRKDVPLKTSSAGIKGALSRKDELFNLLAKDFFAAKKREGSYIVQILCNALWYITNQHQTINDAAKHKKDVHPIPSDFDDYQGFNEVKRKKMKSLPLDSQLLNSHVQALYSIFQKPVMNSSPAWKTGSQAIRNLADCLEAYRKHLVLQNETTQHNQSLLHPARTIAKDATIEHRKATPWAVNQKYLLLDNAVKSAGNLNPVIFDESVHKEEQLKTNLKRFRFIEDLQISVPIDIIRFSPGGSVVSILCITQVSENRSQPAILIDGARLLQQVRPQLQEFHTRAQKKQFKNKIKNIAKLTGSVADFIYKELALDASTAAHPITQERLRVISLGHPGLFGDLRHLNPGRPNDRYNVFFDNLSNIVEQNTAADDRRHGNAHLSEYISLGDMISKAEETCPVGTPIPSKSLARLQFTPRNPFSHATLNFTSRIKIQYKIQRRQLRANHEDIHYCNAQFKYLKEKAVELKNKCYLRCTDDKAKVSFGEPGCAVSTGVRGEKSLVPVNTTLVAMDHDMNKGSLTTSVILNCQIPEKVDKSFVRGKVYTCINDAVFQSVSPFRHAAFMAKVLGNGRT